MRSEKTRPAKITVSIIGGGFSGTILAAKTSSVGRGMAYGTACRSLLLNVRARNMSALADDPHHFLRWAQSNYDPATGPGSFLPRAAYGHYVQAVLNEAAQSAGKPRLEWIRDEALTLSPTSDGATEIRLRSGHRLLADRVVLALGESGQWTGNKNQGRRVRGWEGRSLCSSHSLI